MKTGRVVIVTGGGSGIGKAIAEIFAQNGDNVYILGRRKHSLEVVSAKYPDKIFTIKADVSNPKEVEVARQQILAAHPAVDVLVNCAGASGSVAHGLNLEAALEAWEGILANNLTSTFLMTYAFRPHLKRPGGRIINITSMAAFAGSSRVGGEAYAAAKSAIHGMSRTLVRQLAPEGITINCVSPGFISNTDFFGGKILHQARIAAEAQIPAGRTGQPEDIAPGVFYLASDEASFVNGEILQINGGQQFSR